MYTFTMETEKEAIALVGYFADCGISASRKGKVVKASGDRKLLDYLFNKFIQIALI